MLRSNNMCFTSDLKSYKCFCRRELYHFLIVLCIVLTSGCKKSLQVNGPPTSINGANVYTNDATAIAVLTGIYEDISSSASNNIGGITSISFGLGMSADEFTLFGGTSAQSYIAYYKNALTSSISGFEYWNNFYPFIFDCNSAIEGLSNSTSLTPEVRTQLLGEAKFLRAYFYFYLINLYGPVPLVLTTGYETNESLPRSPVTNVYSQIIADLKDAQTLLSATYLDGSLQTATVERVRPTLWAATALLARTYLYTGDWVDARVQSSSVINNSSLYNLSSLDTVFLKNNSEAIWQLQPVNYGQNSQEGLLFIIPSSGPSNQFPVYMDSALLNSFEIGDHRKTEWIDSAVTAGGTYYYPYKYKVSIVGKPVTEYLTLFRLGELYLIRAESEAEQNDIPDAIVDLNKIRNRAGLGSTTATDQASLLTAIIHERRVEFFAEEGHRWLDLKRTGTVDGVMGVGGACAAKGGSWNTNSEWYPLPLSDIQKDINLVQNNGY